MTSRTAEGLRAALSVAAIGIIGFVGWTTVQIWNDYRREVADCAAARRTVQIVETCVATPGCELTQERLMISARADRYVWRNCR